MISRLYTGALLLMLSFMSAAATTYSYLHREAPTSYWSWPDQTTQSATARVLFTAAEPEYLTTVTTHTFSLIQEEYLYSDILYIDLTIYHSSGSQLGAILYQRKGIVSEFNPVSNGKLNIVIPPTLVSSDFIVEISYHSSLYPYLIPIEFSTPESEIAIEPIGKQWISMDGIDFLPAGKGGAYPFNIGITATSAPYKPTVGLELEHSIYPQNEDISPINRSTEGFVSYEWHFGVGATPATSTLPNPTFKYSQFTSGKREIRLIGQTSEGIRDTLIQPIEVVNSVPLEYFPKLTTNSSIPRATPITLTAIGAWSYSWEMVSPDTLIMGHQAKTTTPHTIGSYIYKLTGTIGGKTKTLSIPINTYAIAHDDRSDAKAIEMGQWYKELSNSYTTTEDGEPSPLLGESESDCRRQDRWCPGNKITNTIWFTFIAPQGQGVKIETKGFDNRIALYKAARWEDLNLNTPELYTLIAANDDGESSNTAIIPTALTTEGERYWIQLDGSNRLVCDSISIQVTAIEKIEYDHIMDYGTLQLNHQTGPFNAMFCGVEPHEPTPYKWDQRLQQTMWFTFPTPTSELLSIECSGTPIRMALYEADTPEDILQGKCRLIADDQTGKGLMGVTLNKSKRYWLQSDRLDQTGPYYLTLNSHPIETSVSAYWSRSQQTIHLISQKEIEQVRVCNVQGQLLYIQEGNHRTDLQIEMHRLPTQTNQLVILMIEQVAGSRQYAKVLIY